QGVLPEYMVPSVYVLLEKFPLTSNGKIAYRSLPVASRVSTASYVPASGSLENSLVGIWSSILQVAASELSVTESFFRMGGHSLKAISLINSLNKELDLGLSLRDIFTYQDIRSLSRYIEGIEKVGVSYKSIPRSEEKERYVLSSAQKRMYFLYEFDKGSTSYNMPSFYRLDSSLELDRLSSVFKDLVARHESLRTRFVLEGSEVYQEVLEGSDFEVSYIEGKETIGAY
ncbi:condensation domain-containing protein, partial [Tenacibaculum sp. FZY0031]|uniref:condensation domain-containing protein n=1 Tax=Tenacibaculum sp. FZY0031 TaxID=3116648 RepID=UPI002EBB6ECE|nr:condensation domain-containing protein [Tenacibaculum sp. FZY0031]